MILAPKTPFALITLILPGPNRKQTPAPYHFRVTYRNPETTEPGCVMTWDVLGGRENYQIALERTTTDDLIWHCTCPDAIYREQVRPCHRCKHVRGLMSLVETIGNTMSRAMPRAG